ncbi:MAG: cupin domain-containing protein [Candidatus Omnitrophota bacterium]
MRIGKRLHELRKDKNMTLEELSKKSGVALASLSRMENNKMAGTLASHTRICKVLGASIAELYRQLEDADKIVESVSHSMRPEHFARDQKARFELLVTKTAGKKITPLILTLKTGGETRKEHDAFGTEKFIYILSGGLDAVIGEKTYSLKCGDSLYFDASLPHMFKNRSRAEAGAMLVIAPPVS